MEAWHDVGQEREKTKTKFLLVARKIFNALRSLLPKISGESNIFAPQIRTVSLEPHRQHRLLLLSPFWIAGTSHLLLPHPTYSNQHYPPHPAMSVVGIDLGAQSTKIGVARNKGIDIVSLCAIGYERLLTLS